LPFSCPPGATDKVHQIAMRGESSAGHRRMRRDDPPLFGLALSHDKRTLLYSVVDRAGSNLMLADKVQ
jgi:hypothetical protein